MTFKEACKQVKALEKQEESIEKELKKLKDLARKCSKQQHSCATAFAQANAEFALGTRIRHKDGRIGVVSLIYLYAYHLTSPKRTKEKAIDEIYYTLSYPKTKYQKTYSGKDIKHVIALGQMRFAAPEEIAVKHRHKIVKICLVEPRDLASRYIAITGMQQAFMFSLSTARELPNEVSIDKPGILSFKYSCNRTEPHWQLTTDRVEYTMKYIELVEDEALILGALM